MSTNLSALWIPLEAVFTIEGWDSAAFFVLDTFSLSKLKAHLSSDSECEFKLRNHKYLLLSRIGFTTVLETCISNPKC